MNYEDKNYYPRNWNSPGRTRVFRAFKKITPWRMARGESTLILQPVHVSTRKKTQVKRKRKVKTLIMQSRTCTRVALTGTVLIHWLAFGQVDQSTPARSLPFTTW